MKRLFCKHAACQPEQSLRAMSAARKTNQRLNEAACAVEGLFGWPLQNDPAVKIRKNGVFGGTFQHEANYLRCEPTQRTMMHEIIHSEDSVNSAIMELLNNGFSYGKPSFVRSKNKFIYRLVAEGRANYGEALLSSKLKRTDVCFYSSIVAASATALYAADAVRYALNSNIALAVIYGALSFLLAYGTLYSFRSWGFKNSIFQLAKKIGDPVKAFRITTDKIPQTLAQILFPSAFYAPEIKQALNEKIDGKPLPIS